MSLGTITDFTAVNSGALANEANKANKDNVQLHVEIVNQVAWLKADKTGDAINLLV